MPGSGVGGVGACWVVVGRDAAGEAVVGGVVAGEAMLGGAVRVGGAIGGAVAGVDPGRYCKPANPATARTITTVTATIGFQRSGGMVELLVWLPGRDI